MQLTRVVEYPKITVADRRLTDMDGVLHANLGDRTNLLLDIPDAKTADCASAWPFRAALCGMMIGLISVVVLNALSSFVETTPSNSTPRPMVMAFRAN